MNGFLRYGERIGFVTLLLNARTLKRADPSEIPDLAALWDSAMISLSPDIRAEMVALRSRMHFEVAKQILFGSPLLMPTLLPVLFGILVQMAGSKIAWWFARGTYRAVERFFMRVMRPLDAAAFQYGATT